jgi:hypothetical protein
LPAWTLLLVTVSTSIMGGRDELLGVRLDSGWVEGHTEEPLGPRESDRSRWMVPVKEDPLDHQQGMQHPDWYCLDQLDPLLAG